MGYVSLAKVSFLGLFCVCVYVWVFVEVRGQVVELVLLLPCGSRRSVLTEDTFTCQAILCLWF